MSQDRKQPQDQEQRMPPAGTGNASNPSPEDADMKPTGNQLLDEKAEKYLGEVSSNEDYPDAADEQEMEKTIRENRDQ